MDEHAADRRTICLSDKVAEFATDTLGTITFGEPFGAVRNQRDEKNILENWRKGLTLLGFTIRSHFFREVILKIPKIGALFLPTTSSESGMGWLMCEADRQVTRRENEDPKKRLDRKPDFLQQ
jgi:hypothetical protein